MSTQPEALRLAYSIEGGWCRELGSKAATELRRLHAANMDCIEHFNAIKAERDEILKALSDIAEWTERYTSPGHPISTIARAAIAKATGEGV